MKVESKSLVGLAIGLAVTLGVVYLVAKVASTGWNSSK